MTVGLIQPSLSFDQAQNCCGLPLGACMDIAHTKCRPLHCPGFRGGHKDRAGRADGRIRGRRR